MPQGISAVRPTNGLYLLPLYIHIKSTTIVVALGTGNFKSSDTVCSGLYCVSQSNVDGVLLLT